MFRQHAADGDAERLHELLDTLLGGEDVVVLLFDRQRAASHIHGFGLSPCQLELVALEIERVVRVTLARPSEVAEEKDRDGRTHAMRPLRTDDGAAQKLDKPLKETSNAVYRIDFSGDRRHVGRNVSGERSTRVESRNGSARTRP